MRYLAAKDKRKRKLFGHSELDQIVFKILYNNTKFSKEKKKFDAKIRAYYKTSPKNQYFTRIRNRCVISGKAGWVFTRFRVSRMQFREMFGKGFLYGLRRSSW